MKKTLVLSTILFSMNLSFAQTAMPGTSLFERFLNTPITKQTVTTGAKIVAGAVVAHKTNFALGTMAIEGVLWYNYLINHPEKMGEFFATHPELLDRFSQYIDYRLEQSQTQQEYETFNNVKQQLALDANASESQSNTINNDPVYHQIEETVRKEINVSTVNIAQSGKMPKCNLEVVAQLLEKKDIFNNGIGKILPSIQTQPTSILNVNSYRNALKHYKNSSVLPLTPDHIPSYGSLVYYFKNHGLNVPTVRRNSDLENNSSAIMVPTQLHQLGSRTYGGRNNRKDQNGDSVMQQDAGNLLEATILDIATTAYLFYSNPQYNIHPLEYIKSSMVLFERNKLLCMYDVK